MNILFTGNAILIFGFSFSLVILSALKKRVHHSTGISNSTGKRKLETQCEETPSKKRKKCQSTGPTPKREETQVVQECANLHSNRSMQVESPNAYVPQAVHLGLPEYRYLWNRIRESLAVAKSQDEKIFYGHLKRIKTMAEYCFLLWKKSPVEERQGNLQFGR